MIVVSATFLTSLISFAVDLMRSPTNLFRIVLAQVIVGPRPSLFDGGIATHIDYISTFIKSSPT